MRGNAREVVASAARTVTGESATLVLDAPFAAALGLSLDITAASGTTPTLDVSVEWSTDGGTTFFKADTADTFAQIIAVKKTVKVFDVKAPHYKVVWTIAGGTPSFTFAVDEYIR